MGGGRCTCTCRSSFILHSLWLLSVHEAELTKFGLCPKPETMRCMTVSIEGVKGKGGHEVWDGEY